MKNSQELLHEIEQRRDELRVQMHLGSMEARTQWDGLEEKWNEFAAKARLREISEDVEQSLKLVGEELVKGYERIKAALTTQ